MMVKLVVTAEDVTSAPMMVFIGALSGKMVTREEALHRIRTSKNKRGDPLHASGPFHLLQKADIHWLLRYCSGVLYLRLNNVERVLTVRTQWSRR